MWRAMGAQARLWRVYRAAVRACAQIQMPAGDLGQWPSQSQLQAACQASFVNLPLLKLTLLLYSLHGPLVWHMRSCS